MNDSLFIKSTVDKYFFSVSHLANTIKVSRQYLHSIIRGNSPLSDYVRNRIEESISAIEHKDTLEIHNPLNKSNVNKYLKKKYGRTISSNHLTHLIAIGKLKGYRKNMRAKWIIEEESLRKFKFDRMNKSKK